MPLLAMGPDGQIMGGVNPNDAEQYGGSAVWQNDDGTIWRQPDGGNDGTANYIRPDLRDAWNKDNQAKQAAMLNNNPAFKQLSPEQVAAYQGAGKGQLDYASANSPTEHFGLYNDSMYGGNNMWFGPEAGPQHTDNGLGWGDVVTGGAFAPYSEQAQSAWNDMRSGLAVMAMPFVGAGITAGLGALGGGAAGAGAAEGGAAAGAGATGVDASTGLFAGESATSGAAGAGAAEGATTGSTALAGSAGSDTLGGSSAMGEDGLDLNLLQDPSYWNPDGGTTGLADPGASGIAGSSTTYGSTDYMQSAQQMAQQLGITPAAALKFLMTAGGAALGASRGGARPAGTTTTTQDLPAWLQPYAQQNVAQGSNILSQLPSNAPLLSASQNEAMKTINGDYLNPNSNPYFASSVNDALGLAKSQFAGMYGGAAGQNINNSGFQEGLARTLGQQATNAYSQNYQNERARQATATFGAPQFASQSSAAPFAGNQAFSGLFPNVSSTSVPYFSNPLGSAFSGALGGYALSGGMGK